MTKVRQIFNVNSGELIKKIADERQKMRKRRDNMPNFAGGAKNFDQKMPKFPFLNLPKTCYLGTFLWPSTRRNMKEKRVQKYAHLICILIQLID
jgi:hypothetical protein